MSVYSASSVGPESYMRPAFRRDYHIAIICALPLEYDAASLLVDEFWDEGGQQYGRTSGDSNTYRNGRIGMHNVVLMLLPSMGKVSVAASAASLRASYVGVRLAFLVGVCGGVPGKNEMILGDVVISDDLVQYDFGRQYPGAFVAKDTIQVHPGPSSKDVRSLISYFRTESGRRDLQDDAARNLVALQKEAVVRRYRSNYRHPGATEDKLFEATYRHRHREPSSCEFCCGEIERFCEEAAGMACAELGCDENRLVSRQRLKAHGNTPLSEVFIGRIASADMVMKSGEHRDQFAEQYGVIAFEMEGAGIWDEFPTIVVKGVCDYADSHKNKSWQPFAAATAAAVTKSLLNRYNFADNSQMVRHDTGFTSSSQDFSSSDTDTDEQVAPLPNAVSTVSTVTTVSTVVQDEWKPLQDAIFHFRRSLNSKQSQILQQIRKVPNVDAVLVFTAQLDSRNRERKGSSIASRFYSTLKSVRDFSATIERSCPQGLSALLWASVTVSVKVIFNTITHYESASKLFMDIGRLSPQSDGYNAFYPASVQLRQSLIKFYASLIRCCIDILKFVQRPWYEYFFGAPQDLSEGEFKPHMGEIRRYSDVFERELLNARTSTQQLQVVNLKESQAQKGPRLKGIFPKTRNTRQSSAWQLEAEQQRARERRQQLLDSLSTYDHLTPLKQSRRKRHAGTAEWLFEYQDFDDWAKGYTPYPVFWCSGKIGSGKTVLVASVIDKLLTDNSAADVSIAFSFVRFDDQKSKQADTILRSILKQAIDTAGLDDKIQTMLDRWQKDLLSDITEIVAILSVASKKLKDLFIIIDGLDECERKDRNELLSGLKALTAIASNLRIFLCGRESVSGEVETAFQKITHTSMSCRPATSDIPKYIESAVQERLQSEELNVGDPTLIEDIKQALKTGADGMFLWVAFQLDELCTRHSDAAIRQAIQDLPSDLTETFKRALRRIISRRNTDMASKCFQWVAMVKRPLSVDELREAISIEIGQEYSRPEQLPNNMKNISSFCENLVHVDEEKNIVQFAHHSVQQFLIHEISHLEFPAFHFDPATVDHHIGEICVTYLMLNDFRRTVMKRPKPPQQVLLSEIGRTVMGSESKSQHLLQSVARFRLGAAKKPKPVDVVGALSKPQEPEIPADSNEVTHPFLKYASANMIFHTRKLRWGESSTWNLWLKLVIEGDTNLVQYPWGSEPFRDDDPAILKWCFEFHHPALIRAIHSYRGMSWSAELNNELCRAVRAADLELVETLLDARANPNGVSDGGLHPLDIAVSVDSADIVHILLRAGAEVNTISMPPNDTPVLHVAARGGNLEIVKRLLAEGADVDFFSKGRTALHEAGEMGDLDVVEALLDAGAHWMIKEYGIEKSLDMAVEFKHPGILRHWDTEACALAKDMDDTEVCDMIRIAISHDHPDVIHGIIHARSPDHIASTSQMIFWMAAGCCSLTVLEYALGQGADPNLEFRQGRRKITALQSAVEANRLRIIEVLLAAGALVNGFPDGPEKILHVAANHGKMIMLMEALDAGADVNAILDEDESFTALHIAAKGGALKVLKRLMNEGRDVYSEIDLAVEKEYIDVILSLINAGADPERRTERGQTPLQIAGRHWGSLTKGLINRSASKLQNDKGRQELEDALSGSANRAVVSRALLSRTVDKFLAEDDQRYSEILKEMDEWDIKYVDIDDVGGPSSSGAT